VSHRRVRLLANEMRGLLAGSTTGPGVFVGEPGSAVVQTRDVDASWLAAVMAALSQADSYPNCAPIWRDIWRCGECTFLSQA
jgi:hypothetical protein